MRQLAQTGYMPNRARMIVAMFLTKDLLVDWRLGEAYFMQKLTHFPLCPRRARAIQPPQSVAVG